MGSKNARTIARLLWFFPVSLFLLAANQFKVGFDLRETVNGGEPATATVTAFEKVDRKDITGGYVSLHIEMADGYTIDREKMALPYSLLHRVEGKEVLDVHVLRSASQEVVIDLVSNAQWRLALIQSAMAFIAALIALVGVIAWNRYLKKHGDPALREAGPIRQAAANASV